MGIGGENVEANPFRAFYKRRKAGRRARRQENFCFRKKGKKKEKW